MSKILTVTLDENGQDKYELVVTEDTGVLSNTTNAIWSGITLNEIRVTDNEAGRSLVGQLDEGVIPIVLVSPPKPVTKSANAKPALK